MTLDANLPLYDRYVLAELGNSSVVSPDIFVAEVLILERSAILAIPFYSGAVLGVTHHQGQILPLVSLRRALTDSKMLLPEKINVVRLSPEAGDLGGMGLVVDRVVSSITAEQYAKGKDYIRLEELLPRLGTKIWEPVRWHPNLATVS